MRMMNSVVAICLLGFIAGSYAQSQVISGQIYKIISASNHTVLDVKQNYIGRDSHVIPYTWKQVDVQNQLWRAEKTSSGSFIFTTMLNEKYALDSWTYPGELIVWPRHGAKNQQWELVQIHLDSFTFYIHSLHDNKVLEIDNHRVGISLKSKDEKNVRQRWIFAEKM